MGSDGYTYCGSRTYALDPAYPFDAVSSIQEDGIYVNQLSIQASLENLGGYQVPMTVILADYPSVTWIETVSISIEEPIDPDTICTITAGWFEFQFYHTHLLDSGADDFDLRQIFPFVGPCEYQYFSVY